MPQEITSSAAKEKAEENVKVVIFVVFAITFSKRKTRFLHKCSIRIVWNSSSMVCLYRIHVFCLHTNLWHPFEMRKGLHSGKEK